MAQPNDDYLIDGWQGNVPGQTQTDPNAPTTVDELTVQAAPRQKPLQPPVNYNDPNYDNSDAVQQANAVNAANNKSATGAGANPGVYGLLPANVQHGTLRNILGALGDAFLVGSGRQAQYEPRMQANEEGQALVGFQQAPGAAASRVAALGYPGTANTAMTLNEQDQQMQLRKQVQEQNNAYRQQVIDARNNAALEHMTPYIGGLAQNPNIKTQEDYQKVYDRATAMAQRIDPKADASVFGLPDPKDWQPGMTSTAGMTGGQVARVGVSEDSITERANASNAHNAVIERGQNIRGGPQPTSGSIMQSLIAKQNSGQPLSPAEQAYWNANTSRGKASRPPLISPGGGQQPQQQFKNGVVYHDAHGNKAMYQNGKWIPQ